VTRQDLQLARELDLVASMHVAGVTPVSRDGFKRIVADDLISDKTNIVHGNDLTDEELHQLTGRGVQFTVTADVELQMGFGNPLTGRLRVLGAPMSIGSDVEITTRPDMFGIIRTTLQTQRNIDHMQSLRTTARPRSPYRLACGRQGQLLFANMAEKKAALQRSGERILRDFGELPRAA